MPLSQILVDTNRMDSLLAIPSTIALPDSTLVGQNSLSLQLQQSIPSLTTVVQPVDPALGVAGDPLPYTVKSDTLLSLVLLGSLLLFIIAVKRSMPFIRKQTRNFFRHIVDEAEMGETSTEVRLQLCLVLLDCLLLGLLVYQYTINVHHTSFALSSHAPIIALYAAVVMAYFVAKVALYTLVNITLFNGKRNLIMLKSLLFITVLQTMLLLPIVLLQVYLGMEQQIVTYLCIFVFIITKLLTFYKAWNIFFRKKESFLQNFLYFCTLEATPCLALAGFLLLLTDAIKINY